MNAKHQTTLHARCPYAPVWDYYDVTVETVDFMQCEKLQAVCDEVRGKEMTQEDVFKHIREGIKNQGSTVTVEGRHGQNGRLVISG